MWFWAAGAVACVALVLLLVSMFGRRASGTQARAEPPKATGPTPAAVTAAQPIACDSGAPETLLVPVASASVSARDLGTPVSASFEPLPGRDGASLFPTEAHIRSDMVGEVDVGWHEYTNAFELDATVRYGLLTAGGGTSRDTYAASYRWRRTLHTLEVDARTAMRKPPRDAAYYLAKLHFGHRLDVVLKGERHALHGSAGLELLKAGGRFGSATSTGQLQLSVQGAGITVPEQSEILVRTRHDVRKTFREASTPAPILAEYRRIPTACPSSRPGLPAPSRARIRFKEILISEDGCYLRCRWKLTVQCEVNGEQVPDLPEPGEWSRREVDDKSCAPKGRAAEDGCVYPLRWTSRVTLFPGDELECWLDGGVENIDDTPLRSTEALVYKHARPAPVAGTLSRAGEAAYTVPYSINFPSN